MSEIIQKAKETMTAKQRVRATFNHERTDRVTIGYETNGAIHARLAQALGIPDGNYELVLQALGVDYRGVPMRYTGPALFEQRPDRHVDGTEGYVMRWVANQSGGYWDFCDFPLNGADDETIANWPVASPDDYDMSVAREYARANPDMGLHVGNPGVADIINSCGRIMGMEDILCHLITGNEAALTYIKRRADLQIALLDKQLAACGGLVDFVWIGEDLGTQIAPMISLELFRKHIRPIQQRFVDLANSYDLPVMIHTCGSSSWAYEDFIEMGIRGVDTLQPEAAKMSPRYLKEHFGERLCYRGCLSTAGPLAYGTEADVVRDVEQTLAIMMPGYGYHFAPTHAIQDNTPTENAIAMYNAAHRIGVYSRIN